MPTSKLINYTTREFMSENELELYAKNKMKFSLLKS